MSIALRPPSFSRTSRQLSNFTLRRLAASQSKLGRTAQLRPLLPGVIRPQPSRQATTGESNKFELSSPLNQSSSDSRPRTALHDSAPLPPYILPSTGLLSVLPRTWVPFAELIRLDKPTGMYYLFLPCLFSTLLAAPLTTPITPPSTVLATTALFFTGALVMRGAGCTINDLWDRNLDPHVARTRLRPIARGAISVQQAIPFLAAQLLVGLGVLVSFPTQCLYYGVPSLVLVGLYPLAKRVTNYPQAVLGLTFSWGAIMGFPALGVDLLANVPVLTAATCLYGSCIAWTIVYDMIYAYQDIRDDAKAGIKSIALAQEANAKSFLTAVAAVQVALLYGAGAAVGFGPVFAVGSCGSTAATLGFMIYKVDLKNTANCWWWFKRGAWLTGGAISSGLAGEYLARYHGLYENKEVSKFTITAN